MLLASQTFTLDPILIEGDIVTEGKEKEDDHVRDVVHGHQVSHFAKHLHFASADGLSYHERGQIWLDELTNKLPGSHR